MGWDRSKPFLQLRLFGGLSVTAADGSDCTPTRRKEQALLAYLALAAQPVARDTLLGLLWPEQPQKSARNNLRVALSRLRRSIGMGERQVIVTTQQHVQLARQPELAVDVHRFDRLIGSAADDDAAAADEWRQLDALYRGDLLAGFYLPDCDEFDTWLFVQREHLRVTFLERLEQLAARLQQTGRLDAALGAARKQIAIDPLRESAYRQMMRLFSAQGQQAAAVRQYELCREILLDELGIEPALETQALFNSLQRKATRRPATVAPSRSVPNNLARSLTPFFGREEERQLLVATLTAGDYRLITLQGPGGIGKTRLALEIGQQLCQPEAQEAFAGGIYWVDLAGVDDPRLIAATIAAALKLGPPPAGMSHEEQLISALEERALLLILDNFEQISAGVELLLLLLRQTERLVLLVTSRARLNVQAEDIVRLSGLPQPAPDVSVEAATQLDAVRLFGDRARRSDKRFRFSADNVEPVCRICRLVEGMPLGIELAAAALGERTVQQIANQLANDSSVLQTTMIDVASQHRSMRAVFNSSWRLLNENQRQMLRRVSVFRGGFSEQAALQTSRLPAEHLSPLVHQSLLRLRRNRAGSRFEMHELLRQLARERLAGEEADLIVDRHSAYFLTLLHEQAAALHGPEPLQAVQRIARELDNVRQAWQSAVHRRRFARLIAASDGLVQFALLQGIGGKVAELLQSALAADPPAQIAAQLKMRLGPLLFASGDFAGVRQAIRPLLADGSADSAAKALAVMSLAEATRESGDYEEGTRLFAEALRICASAAAATVEPILLSAYAFHLSVGGAYKQAGAVAAEALALARARRNARLEQRLLITNATIISEHEDLDEMHRLTVRALALSEKTGDKGYTSRCNNLLGWVARQKGDYEASIAFHRKSLELARQVGDRIQASHATFNLALVLLYSGDVAAAVEIAARAVADAEAHEMHEPQALALYALGYCLLADDDAAAAGRAFAQGRQLYEAIGHGGSVIEYTIAEAAAALAAGDGERARALAAASAPALLDGSLGGIIDRHRCYWECYRVLAQTGDRLAVPLLQAAAEQVRRALGMIEDEAERQTFLKSLIVSQIVPTAELRLSGA